MRKSTNNSCGITSEVISNRRLPVAAGILACHRAVASSPAEGTLRIANRVKDLQAPLTIHLSVRAAGCRPLRQAGCPTLHSLSDFRGGGYSPMSEHANRPTTLAGLRRQPFGSGLRRVGAPSR